MKVYISGPMTGFPEYNFPAFLDAEAQLRDLDHEVLSPARYSLELGFDPQFSLESQPEFSRRECLRWCVSAVLDSERVVTLLGWEYSLGARAEVTIAQAAGIMVMPLLTFFSEEEVKHP
jgi:hypothetical protein